MVVILASLPEFGRSRLLLVEGDDGCLARLLEALGRPCCDPASADLAAWRGRGHFECSCRDDEAGVPCVVAVRTRRDLRALDLDGFDVIVAGVNLPDGSGLDVLADVRAVPTELAVILCGEPGDAAMAVEAIRCGALDFLVNDGPELSTLSLAIEKSLVHQRMKLENERLQRDLSRSLAELGVKNRQLHSVIHQLEVMTRTDELTGLFNRRWLNMKLDELWSDSRRLRGTLACLMIDLDEFKFVNDQHGHQHGDEVLRLAARVIESAARPGDVAARYGGDEFCLLLPGVTWSEARRVAHRIVQEFRARVRSMGLHRHGASLSVGLAHTTLSRPATADQLVSHADIAMYEAKATGRRRVCVYRPKHPASRTAADPAVVAA